MSPRQEVVLGGAKGRGAKRSVPAAVDGLDATTRPGPRTLERPDQGAFATDEGLHFRVWAPNARQVEAEITAKGGSARTVALENLGDGYHEALVPRLGVGTRYLYRLDGAKGLPDPASRFQPLGVHGPSEVVAQEFAWPRSRWKGIPFEEHVFYELHTGTFTREGTFAAIPRHFDALRKVGVTAIELMPVNAFPGRRNWGYDGVGIFAVQASYGGPAALKRLVAAAHKAGLAIFLDVVYNHFGPEGNYAPRFGPYFTTHHHTPWGPGLNFDAVGAQAVRRFFLDNVRQWLEEFRFDGLRLDAVHTILDDSPRHILSEMSDLAQQVARRDGRRVHLVTECGSHDDWMLVPNRKGGRGMDGTWLDDFHHVFDVMLSGERERWPPDYRGVDRLARTLQDGYLYTDILPEEPIGRAQPAREIVPPGHHVAFVHNHDQVGNRPPFRRLSSVYGLEQAKFAAAATILSPHVPLLFMGEEYGEPAPFAYFTDHSDPGLVEAVRQGRKREFPHLHDPPDPQAEGTFTMSRLDHRLRRRRPHAQLQAFYQDLLRLRRTSPALRNAERRSRLAGAHEGQGMAWLLRRGGGEETALILHCEAVPRTVDLPAQLGPGTWRKVLDSAEARWGGPGTKAPAKLEGARPRKGTARSKAVAHGEGLSTRGSMAVPHGEGSRKARNGSILRELPMSLPLGPWHAVLYRRRA